MKRRTTISIALTLSVLLSLVSLPSTAQGQQQRRFVADTGMVAFGPHLLLRLWVLTDQYGDIPSSVSFRRLEYTQGACNEGVCRHFVSSTSTPSVTLAPGEAASLDVTPTPGSSGVRVVVTSNRRNVRVTATIINTVTGETTSHIIMANTEGDFH